MQHPSSLSHSTATPRMTPQRLTGLAFAGLIQAGLIYALILGLTGRIGDIVDRGPIVTHVIPAKPPTQPPPGPIDFVHPTAGAVVPPQFHESDISHAITLPPGTGGGNRLVFVDTPPRAIASTHTSPDYPIVDRRLDHQGTVVLRLAIAPDGRVADAAVASSSGYATLDEAAIAWVKAHWRYAPALHDGAPVASTADAAIRFDLRTARE